MLLLRWLRIRPLTTETEHKTPRPSHSLTLHPSRPLRSSLRLNLSSTHLSASADIAQTRYLLPSKPESTILSDPTLWQYSSHFSDTAELCIQANADQTLITARLFALVKWNITIPPRSGKVWHFNYPCSSPLSASNLNETGRLGWWHVSSHDLVPDRLKWISPRISCHLCGLADLSEITSQPLPQCASANKSCSNCREIPKKIN